MGQGALRKDFSFPPGEWSDDHAQVIDEFFEEIVARHLTIKTGTYLGTGREKTVDVTELPGPPKLLLIQPSAGGAVFLALVAVPSGSVSAWTHTGFTLSTAAAVNTQNVSYNYLILA